MILNFINVTNLSVLLSSLHADGVGLAHAHTAHVFAARGARPIKEKAQTGDPRFSWLPGYRCRSLLGIHERGWQRCGGREDSKCVLLQVSDMV